MNLDQVETTAKNVLVHCLHVTPEKLNGATTWADVNADSLARIEVMLALEDVFKVTIPDEEALKFKTFADVVGFLHRQVESRRPAASTAAP